MFNLSYEELVEKQAIHTAREIHQQPKVWQEVFNIMKMNKSKHDDFIRTIFNKAEFTRVIFTGAGTSAFVGDTLVPELTGQSNKKVSFEAIATTDIVSNPKQYLKRNVPTILVSFARSGNSPESVATVDLAEKLIDDLYQVVITCNKDGQLAERTDNDSNSLLIILPDRAHDQGFAMTSSFTGMALAAYLLFSKRMMANETINQLVTNAENILMSIANPIEEILTVDFERLIYLGSGLLGQLSHEAALKMLELTAGKVVALHESSLGFRHGPKSVLESQSLVVVFVSADSHTRKYDLDIIREIALDSPEVKLVAVTPEESNQLRDWCNWVIKVDFSKEKLGSDFQLALLEVIFAQALALKKSLHLGITPDNPSPSGRVNRVVQGVTIHPWKG